MRAHAALAPRPDVGGAADLRELTLCFNKLDGALPGTLGRMTQLDLLWMSNNAFEDEIPASVCELRRLTRLYLTSNFLSGTVPACVADMTSLATLDVSYNALTGSVPTYVPKGRVAVLFGFFVSQNLSSSVPLVACLCSSNWICRSTS